MTFPSEEQLENLDRFADALEDSGEVCNALKGKEKQVCRMAYVSAKLKHETGDEFKDCFTERVEEDGNPKEAVEYCLVREPGQDTS